MRLRGLASISQPAFSPGFCRYCGCTDNQACPGGCYWLRPNICSACAGRAGIVCEAVGEVAGMKVYIDPALPPDTIEFRHQDGRIDKIVRCEP